MRWNVQDVAARLHRVSGHLLCGIPRVVQRQTLRASEPTLAGGTTRGVYRSRGHGGDRPAPRRRPVSAPKNHPRSATVWPAFRRRRRTTGTRPPRRGTSATAQGDGGYGRGERLSL